MATWLLLAILSAAGADSSAADVVTPSAPDFKPRPYHQYERVIDDALRAEARAKDQHERAEAVRRLAALYREVLRDPRLETSDTLKGYKAKLWSRLNRVKNDLQRKLDREAKLAKQREPDADTQALQQATQSLADQLNTMNYTMGGPAYVLTQTGGAWGGGLITDHGQELVDLIEHTIRPDFWDTAGGPGSIFYFRPLMALVVRATDEVHGSVGGLMDALRRAGN